MEYPTTFFFNSHFRVDVSVIQHGSLSRGAVYWIDLCRCHSQTLLNNYPASSSNVVNSSVSELKSIFFVLFDSWSL